MTEHDLALRRIERESVVACAVIAGVAWMLSAGQARAPLGVLGGGALVAISYRGIKGGIDALGGATSAPEAGGQRMVIGLVKFFTRYAILAAVAYLIMARLHMPPVAVFAGASSVVVAVTVEALRGVASRQR